MLKTIERETGAVEVEIDAPQGKILLVRCPEHGAMSIRYTDMAWVCNHVVKDAGAIGGQGLEYCDEVCGRTYPRVEAQQLIDQCYEEIRQQDQREFREDQQRSTQRLIDRQNERRADAHLGARRDE